MKLSNSARLLLPENLTSCIYCDRGSDWLEEVRNGVVSLCDSCRVDLIAKIAQRHLLTTLLEELGEEDHLVRGRAFVLLFNSISRVGPHRVRVL